MAGSDHFSAAPILPLALAATLVFSSAAAETEPEQAAPAMSGERLQELIRQLDPEAQIDANSVQFRIGDRQQIAIYDSEADRMRLMSPIAEVEILDENLMYRILQANYDSALDARYATANGVIWSVFVHPLSSLGEEFLASAIGQVHTAAENFGTTFSSGELIFGGGDSQEQLEELQEALERLRDPGV